jgi:DNA transformation protein and related proteins
MFGGYTIRKNGLSFALIFDDEIYFKVDDTNRKDYERMESTPFTYEAKGKVITVSSWKVPIEVLEDFATLMEWIEKSYQVAMRASAKRK